jgi:peptidoglycan/LPS O-acetylase OafA/YrhL
MKPVAGRVPELDGIRGVAIGMVLLYHYCVLFPVHKGMALYYLLLPTHLMWSGVDLFFVLSGFLIGGILLDNRQSFKYYSVFYARRVYRIFPIYYIMIAAQGIGTLIAPQSQLFHTNGMPLWVYPIFAQNLTGDFTRASVWLGVTWSLAVEEQFYLLFPMVVKRSRHFLFAVLAICVVGAPLLRTLLILKGLHRELVYPLLPCRADSLALGVVAALLVRSETAKTWTYQHRGQLIAVLLILAGCAGTMLKFTVYILEGTAGYSIFGLAYFIVLLLVVMGAVPALSGVLRTRILIWLGSISYCVYLVHQPMRTLSEILLPGRPLLEVLLALTGTLAVAQASWILIERGLVRHAHVRYRY